MSNVSPLPFCDLVMKGGITSGIIYPRLVAKLAESYRFKSIGGSSAGAIGAGAAAAAEYGRSHGNNGAFVQLNALPDKLGARQYDDRSKLFHLFQPHPKLADHFAVLQASLNAGDKKSAALAFFRAMLLRFGLPFWICLLLGVAVLSLCLLGLADLKPATAFVWSFAGFGIWISCLMLGRFVPGKCCDAGCTVFVVVMIGTFAASLVHAANIGLAKGAIAGVATTVICLAAIVLGVAWTMARFAASFAQTISRNNFGICSGLRKAGSRSRQQALTEWLHELYNGLAGLTAPGDVLTFGHLWGCREPANPVSTDEALNQPDLRAIDLEMMTTALCQRMPYRLPFTGSANNRLLFDKDEWRELFPDPVFKAIECCSTKANAKHPVAGRELWHLPEPWDFPVVAAVRMSLSFPVLLSAVPLYAVDRTLTSNKSGNEKATRVWFSDGGISSNLPLHFFDSKLPSHPTFAINLKTFHPDYQPLPGEDAGYETGRVYLPRNNREGIWQHWTTTETGMGITSLIGFLWSIVDTMQCWRDQIQFPYPGYRDRIVQISQRADEGGLNLDMPEKNIVALGNAGEHAADALIGRFAAAGQAQQGAGWENHRAIRLRTLLGQFETMLLEIDASDRRSADWRGLLRNLPAYDFKSPRAQHEQLAEDLLNHVNVMAQELRQARTSDVSLTNGAPKPVPEMRISPVV